MGLTKTFSLTSGRYVVEFYNNRSLEKTLDCIIKYYCKHSKDYVVTFEVDNGARHFSIAIDCLWYKTGSANLIYHLMRNYITGVIVEDLKEAHAIESEIEKGHMWDLLKE